MFSTARWRLTLWFTAVFAVILVVICTSVYFAARQSLLRQVQDDLEGQTRAALDREPGSGGGPIGLPDTTAILRTLSASGSFFVVTDLEGNIEESTASLDADTLNLPPVESYSGEAARQNASYRSASTDSGDHLRVNIRRVFRPQQGEEGYLMIGKSIESELQTLRRLALILVGFGGAGLVFGAWGGFFLAGLVLKPIQRSMDAQRQFVADASHELRTPLSLIRANAEVMKRGADKPFDTESIDDIISETDRLTYLVSQMLTLARSESSADTFEKTHVDVNSVAEDVTRQMRLLATPKQIEVVLRTDGAAAVYGDEQRLGELLLILLDNAIKYTDEGGKVDVDVAQADGHVRIAVADTGRGISVAALPHVFDRFYRADKARSREMGGTGLGLAIARWIAEMHGGTIDIKSEAGQGTRVTVELPASG